MRRSWQPASAFSRAGRSGGRPALQLPRTSTPAEVLHPAPFPTAHRRSRNFPFRYCLRPSGEVWRAPGPPAPATPGVCNRASRCYSILERLFCRNGLAEERISMKIKWYHWIIPIAVILVVSASAFGWLVFEDNRRLLCRFALGAVATSLELYQDKFGELPPSLEILSKEFPDYRTFVYLGYRPWPWSRQFNGASLLYNRLPSANSSHPVSNHHTQGGSVDDILLAAPIPVFGKRIVIFHCDFANRKRLAGRYHISESVFSNYWTTDEQQQQLIPRRR